MDRCKLTPEQLASQLQQFTGTESWTRWNPILFKNIVASEGAIFLAENAGAYWLLDAVASWWPTVKQNAESDFVFWRLTVRADRDATLQAFNDTPDNFVQGVVQKIEYTDFPLGEVTLYQSFDGERVSIFLPSEY